MRQVTVAATQMPCSWDTQGNITRAEKLVQQAAEQGAQIILIQELPEKYQPLMTLDGQEQT